MRQAEACGQQKLCAGRGRACPVFGGVKPPSPRNRMREIFTSGSVGGASGNRHIYPEPDSPFLTGKLTEFANKTGQVNMIMMRTAIFLRPCLKRSGRGCSPVMQRFRLQTRSCKT
ncbi:Uncharacterized protein dnm_023820 [Desulfonema magnum]|uniref:Uncharacterized protein n=1 Tax=Desulfonema magnum TaxID=45655 RepID=A0A975BIL0_9BACT|nr:Uncharacterized protein dnm_023820 [Desulfonema magnum]